MRRHNKLTCFVKKGVDFSLITVGVSAIGLIILIMLIGFVTVTPHGALWLTALLSLAGLYWWADENC